MGLLTLRKAVPYDTLPKKPIWINVSVLLDEEKKIDMQRNVSPNKNGVRSISVDFGRFRVKEPRCLGSDSANKCYLYLSKRFTVKPIACC